MYGEKVISRQAIEKWCDMFKNGRIDITDDYRVGRPSTSRTTDNIARINEVIRTNRRITIDEIAETLAIYFGSAQQIITQDLDYRKVCSRWVPRVLTDEHKFRRLQASNSFLSRFEIEGNAFLDKIVTGDET